MADTKAKKQIPLRLSAKLYDQIAAWAEDDFRSVMTDRVSFVGMRKAAQEKWEICIRGTGCSPRTGYIRDRIIFLLDFTRG